jgi:hypothetical protein
MAIASVRDAIEGRKAMNRAMDAIARYGRAARAANKARQVAERAMRELGPRERAHVLQAVGFSKIP